MLALLSERVLRSLSSWAIDAAIRRGSGRAAVNPKVLPRPERALGRSQRRERGRSVQVSMALIQGQAHSRLQLPDDKSPPIVAARSVAMMPIEGGRVSPRL